MDRLEVIDGNNWKAFTEEPGVAVLMLAKTGCPARAAWTDELTEYLAADPQVLGGVRFGKMLLDKPGLADLKRNNLWLASEVDVVPYNVIYSGGRRHKSFPGGGMERLETRLKQLGD